MVFILKITLGINYINARNTLLALGADDTIDNTIVSEESIITMALIISL